MRIVTAAVIVKHSRVLLLRRAPGQSGAGSWEFPGGKLEQGEDERVCLARELDEELSISGTVGALVAENLHAYTSGAILLRAYWFDWQSGDLTLTVHDDMSWVSPRALIHMPLSPADVPIARRVADLLSSNREKT